jgi:transcriptional regulator with XRE-family HTH domain
MDWREKASKLLEGNLTNLGRKVLAGEPLTAAEVNILRDAAAEKGDGPAQRTFAKNQTELAEMLGVSRKTIQRYAKRDDAPAARSDGRLSVREWREYLGRHDVLGIDEDVSQTEGRARQILLQNKKLEIQIREMEAVLVPTVEVEKSVGEMIGAAKGILLTGPAALAPQVVGVSIPEAETILREWLHDALARLHQNPLGLKPKGKGSNGGAA